MQLSPRLMGRYGPDASPQRLYALVFSLGTRNSFVVLPLALTQEWRLAIVGSDAGGGRIVR